VQLSFGHLEINRLFIERDFIQQPHANAYGAHYFVEFKIMEPFSNLRV